MFNSFLHAFLLSLSLLITMIFCFVLIAIFVIVAFMLLLGVLEGIVVVVALLLRCYLQLLLTLVLLLSFMLLLMTMIQSNVFIYPLLAFIYQPLIAVISPLIGRSILFSFIISILFIISPTIIVRLSWLHSTDSLIKESTQHFNCPRILQPLTYCYYSPLHSILRKPLLIQNESTHRYETLFMKSSDHYPLNLSDPVNTHLLRDHKLFFYKAGICTLRRFLYLLFC